MPRDIPIGIGIGGEGAHPAAWRAARHAPELLLTRARLTARFQEIERAGFAFAILPEQALTGAPDVTAALDAVELGAFAAALTERIGIVVEAGAIHAEPYHLANQLSSLDRGSHGRGGWLVHAEDPPARAAGYGRLADRAPAASAHETAEVVGAVRRLWDTWEDDVLIADAATGRFLDLDRWHHADFRGELFSIKGPGLLPRPPQGQVPVWARPGHGGTAAPPVGEGSVAERSQRHDARWTDLVDILLVADAESAREASAPRVVREVEVIVDAGGATAAERVAALDAATPWTPAERARIAGSPLEVVGAIAGLAVGVDGLVLHPAVLDVDVPVLAAEVLPGLERAGVLRPQRTGETLRDLFDLPRPRNVFELERSRG